MTEPGTGAAGPDDPDRISLTSIGVDIGTATSHVLFSRIDLARASTDLSSRYEVVSRTVLYRSPVRMTPYVAGNDIDETRLGGYIDTALAEAGLGADQVDTGAVILTGEATRRTNARAVADLFAGRIGQFVCATAGHHMEAILAAHGSGAVRLSRENASRVLNIDIGGGTTKFSAITAGEVVQTAAIHVGGRLAAFDADTTITRLEPMGRQLATEAGAQWELGGAVSPDGIERVASTMARAVTAAANGRTPERPAALWLTEPLEASGPYDTIVFSGGVSGYIDGQTEEAFGDLGPALGEALRARLHELPGPVSFAASGMLATVIGASQYTVQVSGATIYISDPAVLPIRNARVIRPAVDLSGDIAPATIAEAIRAHRRMTDGVDEGPLAIALRWEGPPSYPRLNAFVSGFEEAVADVLTRDDLICLVFDGDVGRAVGELLREEHGHRGDVVSIDGVALGELDYIDIGRPHRHSGTVPVSIRSLVFRL